MRKFIVKSAFFLVALVLVFGSICFFELRDELQAYHRELAAPPQADILVCGDSQLQMSVDPGVEPRFFNFSAPGRTMDQIYLSCIDLFRENPGRFKRVLIDISPSAAIDTFDQPIPKMGYASQYYLLHWLHRRESVRDMTGELAVFRDNMVGRRWRLFWRSLRGRAEFKSSIYGCFLAEPLSLVKVNPDGFRGQWKARVLHVNSSPSVTADAPIFRHVGAIVRLAREQGATPVIVTTPWHTALRGACQARKLADFRRAVAEHARKSDCAYIDLMNAEFPDGCWYDAQHLNVRGARAFTQLLLNALTERGQL